MQPGCDVAGFTLLTAADEELNDVVPYGAICIQHPRAPQLKVQLQLLVPPQFCEGWQGDVFDDAVLPLHNLTTEGFVRSDSIDGF